MTDERLAEIRQHADTMRSWLTIDVPPGIYDVRQDSPAMDTPYFRIPSSSMALYLDVVSSLREIDRLRTENADLREQIAYWRSMYLVAGSGE